MTDAWHGKTVFVTGGTGFVGGALVKRLSDEGATVRALVRRPGRDAFIRDLPRVEQVEGNITDADRLREVLPGTHTVFHVAAATSGPPSVQEPINIDGTRNVAAASAAAGVQHLLHVSSIAVYGPALPPHVTEETRLDPGQGTYHRTKKEAEDTLKTIAAETGLSYSIVRPGMIYGPRSGAWTRAMFRLAKSGYIVGDGSGTMYPIFIDDLIDLMLLMATHPAAEGETFNAVSDEIVNWHTFLSAYQQLAGITRKRSIPVPLLRLIAPFAELGLWVRGTPEDVRDLVDFITRKQVISVEKAQRLLNWMPQISLAEGVARCQPYLRELGLL